MCSQLSCQVRIWWFVRRAPRHLHPQGLTHAEQDKPPSSRARSSPACSDTDPPPRKQAVREPTWGLLPPLRGLCARALTGPGALFLEQEHDGERTDAPT